jgi:hypothetical protein
MAVNVSKQAGGSDLPTSRQNQGDPSPLVGSFGFI